MPFCKLSFIFAPMFTGIIETTGTVHSVKEQGSGRIFMISSPLAAELKPDQSLAHNGVCLTVEALENGMHQVTAVFETLKKTTLGIWETGTTVNLERCLKPDSRLDGHFVQGHVDATAACLSVDNQNGSWLYRFSFPESFAPLVIEKGSVCIDGISLTAFDVTDSEFSVAIIPYTWEHTNIRHILPGDKVNIEFDVLGKYIRRGMELSARQPSAR